VNKFTPMVFQNNPGWSFFPQLKWINSQMSDCAMDSTEVPPAGRRQITSTNTSFIRHCPNQSEHHSTLPNIIPNYPSVFKIGVLSKNFMPDAHPDATLSISRLGTGFTNGPNNGRGWGLRNSHNTCNYFSSANI
jgi:hypothetical protein